MKKRPIRPATVKLAVVTPRLEALRAAALADPETGGPVLVDALLEAGILVPPKAGKRRLTERDAERHRKYLVGQALKWAHREPPHKVLRTVGEWVRLGALSPKAAAAFLRPMWPDTDL